MRRREVERRRRVRSCVCARVCAFVYLFICTCTRPCVHVCSLKHKRLFNTLNKHMKKLSQELVASDVECHYVFVCLFVVLPLFC